MYVMYVCMKTRWYDLMPFSHNFPRQCSGKHDEKFHEEFSYVEALIDALKAKH